MLRTKLAKKVLTKKEQKHLTESKIHTMEGMKRQIAFMDRGKEDPDWKPSWECYECRTIARKLGLDGKGESE